MALNKISRQTMIDHCKREVKRGSIYVWGAQGERGAKITTQWIKNRENTPTNATRAINKWNANKKKYDPAMIGAYDCSGLIAACLNENGNPGWDNTADGMLRMCTQIKKSELQPGDFVFEWTVKANKSNHIGVYIGDNKVIESKGRDDGVLVTDLNSRNWIKYGRPDFCYTDAKKYSGYVASTPPQTVSTAPQDVSKSLPEETYYFRMKLLRTAPMKSEPTLAEASKKMLEASTSLRYRGEAANGFYHVSVDDGSGNKGYVQTGVVSQMYLPVSDGVKAIQRALKLPVDGIYGKKTADAVLAFQKAHGLTADAIYGPKTKKALQLNLR